MEYLKFSAPSNSSHLNDSVGCSIEARFSEYCKSGLCLNGNSYDEAVKLFRYTKHLLSTNMSTIGTVTPEETERYWFAFILYSAKRLSKSSADDSSQRTEGNGFTLCQTLRVANLSLVDFFKELPQFLIKAGPLLSNQYGADWETRLEAKELQENFEQLSHLSKYYKLAFWEFFLTSDVDGVRVYAQSAVEDATDRILEYSRLGWLLFLALRTHAFSEFKDLFTCTNGLVAILAILIIHVPVRLRNFNIHDSPCFGKKGCKGVDLLASLCSIYQISEDELRKTMGMANDLIIDILKKNPRPASRCRAGSLENIDTDDLIYFEDLMEKASVSSSIDVLEKDYADATHSKGELDERLFANDEESLLGSGSLSVGVINFNRAKREIDPKASPTMTISSPLTHSSSRKAATPTTAMTTAKWLRLVISPLPPKLSPELGRFLSSCNRDVTTDITRRANILLEAIFPCNGLQCTLLMDSIWAEQRKLEALKLYYRVLQAMCTAESQMLNASNLTPLLTNERFHRCMLACSAELVFAAHKTVMMLFPVVLERTGITAFDLSKVIESFIRHEESLPRELKRHLNSLEEQFLESVVWEKGSSMYNSLTAARPSLSSEINGLGLLAEPMPSLDAIAMHTKGSFGSSPCMPSLQNVGTLPGQHRDIRSPKRLCTKYRNILVERKPMTSPVKDLPLAFENLKAKLLPPALQSAFASPTRPNPGGGGETCAETAINIFFSKIVKLAAVRINGMVERLQLSQQTRETVYCLFQQILSQRTTLFFNHHIDLLMLCCFFGVAKISQLKVTFKDIILQYRKQPQCKPQVFRNVFADWSSARCPGSSGQEHVVIKTFYNEIFIPSVKPLLVELGPVGIDQKATRNSQFNNNSIGQCPGSPKSSTFPSLPDMSPRKVSAVHNVYVSPLRSTKMDALISNGSKSYYACVGESTHAYQSPSKDLTAINNQLNGNRKVRGMINFDNVDVDVGLVSDSMVANSLCLRSGRCALSSGAIAVKSEQLEL